MSDTVNGQTVWILGAGFAGLQAAKAILGKSKSAQVVLVDRNRYSTMIPALPDVLSGRVRREAIGRPLEEIFSPALRSRIHVRCGAVTSVDLDARTLVLEGREHTWERLLIATGSVPEYYGFAPESPMHSVHTREEAEKLRNEFAARMAAGDTVPVIIVGAGYTGLEVAVNLRRGAEAAGLPQPEITVVERAETVLPFLPDRQRAHVQTFLDSLNIRIMTGTSLTRFTGQGAELSDGSRIENALVCWAAGMTSAAFTLSGRVERTADGRIRTDDSLQVPGYPGVFAAGDAAAIRRKGVLQRRAVNFAWYSGRRAGKNILATLESSPIGAPIGARTSTRTRLRPFFPVDLGWVIPLGGTSVGLVFGLIRVRGGLGLRMHYVMCGIRHFGVRQALEFFRTALRLSRTPDPPG